MNLEQFITKSLLTLQEIAADVKKLFEKKSVSLDPDADNGAGNPFSGDIDAVPNNNSSFWFNSGATNRPPFIPQGGFMLKRGITATDTNVDLIQGWGGDGDALGYRCKFGGAQGAWFQVASREWVNAQTGQHLLLNPGVNDLSSQTIDGNNTPLGSFLAYANSQSTNLMGGRGFLFQHRFSFSGSDFVTQKFNKTATNDFYARSGLALPFIRFWHDGDFAQADIDNWNTALIDIANIWAILNSDDTTLDDLQEIVDYIKQNKEDLQNLSIPNIAGLVDALANKLERGGYSGTAQDLKDAIDGKASVNDSRFHTHSNKALLDAITQAKIDQWDQNGNVSLQLAAENGSNIDGVLVSIGNDTVGRMLFGGVNANNSIRFSKNNHILGGIYIDANGNLRLYVHQSNITIQEETANKAGVDHNTRVSGSDPVNPRDFLTLGRFLEIMQSTDPAPPKYVYGPISSFEDEHLNKIVVDPQLPNIILPEPSEHDGDIAHVVTYGNAAFSPFVDNTGQTVEQSVPPGTYRLQAIGGVWRQIN